MNCARTVGALFNSDDGHTVRAQFIAPPTTLRKSVAPLEGNLTFIW